MSRREILFTTGSMGRGGAERVLSILASELSRRGWKVHIAMLLNGEIGYDLPDDVDVVDISRKERNQWLDTPRMILQTRRIIRKLKPCAVVSFMLTINIVTWLATRGLQVRFIPSERNDPSKGRGGVKRFLSCKAYAASYRTVLQTERARSCFSRKIQDRSVIIPNPIQVDQLRSEHPGHKIISVGRLEPQKNRKLLIEAFSDIADSFPEYSLHIYGEGSQERELKTLIESLGLTDRIEMHGNVLDVHRQMADGEIFVLSSDYEGLSNALLEAVMMGFPCITTDCAGAREAVEDGVNGLIVPVGDRAAMAKAMAALIQDTGKREAFSRRSVEHAGKFRIGSIVNQWEHLLEEEDHAENSQSTAEKRNRRK